MKKPQLIEIIAMIMIMIAMSFLGLVYHILEVKADTIRAHCPTEGCVFLDWTYYADFEKNSKEYWRHYCNSMVDTKFECK